ncbi:MAG: hypothetical protein PHF84_10565 [bacterium]|nr:hypothetical protein [bacterium]
MKRKLSISILLLSLALTPVFGENPFSFGYFFGFNNNSPSYDTPDTANTTVELDGVSTMEMGLVFQYLIYLNNLKIGLDLDIAIRDMTADITITQPSGSGVDPLTGEVPSETSLISCTYDYLAISFIGKYYFMRFNTVEDFGIEPFAGFGLVPQFTLSSTDMNVGEDASSGLVFGIMLNLGAKVDLAKGFAIEPEVRYQLNLNSAESMDDVSLGFNNLFILASVKILL